jgi:hypothetical protein
MTPKSRLVVTITVLGVCIGGCILVVLFWPNQAIDDATSFHKQTSPPANPLTGPAKAESQTEPSVALAPMVPFSHEPIASALPPPHEPGTIGEIDLPSPVAPHDMTAVRIALEKSNRPDLQNGPSASERTRELRKTQQITEEELSKLSTEELIDKVASSSLFIFMFYDFDPDGGVSRYASTYNGVNAVLDRPDAGKALLKRYEKLSAEVSKGTQDKASGFTFRFAIMENLMASEKVIKHLSHAERAKVVASIIKAIDIQAQYDASRPEPEYGESKLEWTCAALVKYLTALDCPEYRKWYDEKQDPDLLIKRFLTYPEGKEILAIARKYVQNHVISQGGQAP